MDIKPAPRPRPDPEPAEDVIIEDQDDNTPTTKDVPPKPSAAKAKGKKLAHIKWWIKTHKVISVVVLVVVLAGIGGGVYLLLKKPAVTPAPVAKKEEPEPVEPAKPTMVASPLTGVQVSPEDAARPVTGMMVENSPDARPQSGLADAGVVFEATAEGGITRFLVLWQEGKPGNIGPCRSLRPYYIDWALPFQASVGHVGGSPQALAEAKDVGLRDLDQFANGPTYHRTSDRYAPHNMYTNTTALDALNKQKGYTKSEFTAWPRKQEAPSAAPTTSKVSYDISSALFHVDFAYDKATNSYIRSIANTVHKDRESGKPLSPKVVVVLKMAHRLVDSQHYGITTTGSGEAFIYQDGIETKGTWKKDSRSSMFQFLDANGAAIKLNAGQVWVGIIPADRNPKVTP